MRNNNHRRTGSFWPLLLIGVGGLLLLQNFGLLPPHVWEALVPLWPILLVVLGLDVLIGRHSRAGRLVTLAAAAGLVTAALIWAALRATQLSGGQVQTLTQSAQAAQSASVKLQVSVGDLNLSALTDENALMAGEVRLDAGDSVRQSYGVRAGVGQLVLAQQQNALLAPFLSGSETNNSHWDIQLTTALPLTLEVRSGLGTANLDLSELNLQTLDLRTDIGQTVVNFPDAGQLLANVETGIGETVLTIPPDMPTRITLDSSLTNVRIPARFARTGEVYTTAEFSPAGHYLELKLKAGVGSVTVK